MFSLGRHSVLALIDVLRIVGVMVMRSRLAMPAAISAILVTKLATRPHASTECQSQHRHDSSRNARNDRCPDK